MKLHTFLELTPKKYIIFDFDKTLITLNLPWELFKKDIEIKLTELDPELALKLEENKRVTHLLNEFIKKHGHVARNIINPYKQWFEKECLEKITKTEHLLAFIKENRTAYKFYIWSSNSEQTIHTILKENAMDTMIEKVVASESVHLLKPYPDGFYLIFDPNHQKRSEYLMIGDSQNDRDAAESAGIDYLDVKDIET